MAWIRIDDATPHKPEIARLALSLRCSLGDAFLEFVRLYLWADANVACPGFVPEMSLELLGQLSRVRPGTCEALASDSICWLHAEHGGVQFTNWERHNGKSAKQRVYERERKQTYRSNGTKCGTNNGTNNGTKGGTKCAQEKRREDNTPIVPKGTYAQCFELWWEQYPKHLRVSKAAAYRAYVKAGKMLVETRSMSKDQAAGFLLAKAIDFANSPRGHRRDVTLNPSTWLNAGRFDDPIEALQQGDHETKPLFKDQEAEFPVL